MDDLKVLPIVLIGVGVLMVWGGLSGNNPVARVRQILTRGGVQTSPDTSADNTPQSQTLQRYQVRRDYLA